MSTGPKMVDITRGPEVVEERDYRSKPAPRSKNPSEIIPCPFCGTDVLATSWSLMRVGKRCDCGALHTASGKSYQWAGAPGVGDTETPPEITLTQVNLTFAATALLDDLTSNGALDMWEALTGLHGTEAKIYAAQLATAPSPVLAFLKPF